MKPQMTSKEIILFHSDRGLIDGYSWINKSQLNNQWLSKDHVEMQVGQVQQHHSLTLMECIEELRTRVDDKRVYLLITEDNEFKQKLSGGQ